MNEVLMQGKYFLGDPSIVLPEKIYIGIWGNLYNYDNGKFNILGKHLCVHNTHYGDGVYIDTRNRKYMVESGVIGLVPLELIENIELCNNNGHIFNFKKPVYFMCDGGVFIIKSDKKYIKIDTQNMEEYNSSDDEQLKNDDGEPMIKTFCNNSDDDFIDDENDKFFDDEEEIEETIKESCNISKFNFFKK